MMKRIPISLFLTLCLVAGISLHFAHPAQAQNTFVPGVHTLQVTVGASTTQFTSSDTPCLQVIVQNNAAHSMRVGDSATSSSRGAVLNLGPGGGSMNLGPYQFRQLNLNQMYVNGTNGDVLDVLYVQ